MKDRAIISVIGDGGWGTTLAVLLHKKGYRVRLWSAFKDYAQYLDKRRVNTKFLPGVKIPEGIFISNELKAVAGDSDISVIAVPSQYARGVLKRLNGKIGRRAVIVSVIKGIENDTLMRPSEVIEEELGKFKLAVLSGPSIAPEVARGVPTSVVAASDDGKTARLVQDIFMTERLRVYTSVDVVGVELGGSLKNVIAIAAGICDGLGFGANTKSALLTRGLVEMTKLGVSIGAKRETFYGLSGLGDLITTCISTKGRNRWVGEQIGRGRKLEDILKDMEMVAEGIKTSKAVYRLSGRYAVEMPISREVYAILYENKPARSAVSDLMLRAKKAE